MFKPWIAGVGFVRSSVYKRFMIILYGGFLHGRLVKTARGKCAEAQQPEPIPMAWKTNDENSTVTMNRHIVP